eukprot:656367-Pleurochrysis_carterae.AAC.1
MSSEAVERNGFSLVCLLYVLRVLASRVSIREAVGDGAGGIWRWRASVKVVAFAVLQPLPAQAWFDAMSRSVFPLEISCSFLFRVVSGFGRAAALRVGVVIPLFV